MYILTRQNGRVYKCNTLMDTRALFSTLGLGPEHAAIYYALLQKGPLSMAQLAREARLHRPAAYKLVPELEERGIVKKVLRGKRTYFAAESPEKLGASIDEAHRSSTLLLHELQDRFERKKRSPEIAVGHGKKAIASVYDDILHVSKRGDVFYRYSSASKKRPKNAYVPQDYEARRDAKRLERYVITNKRTSALKAKKLERYIRIIPPEFDRFEFDITLLVYADKVAYIDYGSETAITIENPAVAQFQRRLFQLLFSRLS